MSKRRAFVLQVGQSYRLGGYFTAPDALNAAREAHKAGGENVAVVWRNDAGVPKVWLATIVAGREAKTSHWNDFATPSPRRLGKPRVITKCVANNNAGQHERIIEFGAGTDGTGGLISFHLGDDGSLVVNVYRMTGNVTVVGATYGESMAGPMTVVGLANDMNACASDALTALQANDLDSVRMHLRAITDAAQQIIEAGESRE